MRQLADYTDCGSRKVVRVPRQLFIRLEEVDELESLRKDVPCYQDQPVQ